MDINKYYKNCTLCPRNCHIDRSAGLFGFCGQDMTPKVAKAYPHMWEEPCISGENGSGTVFFCGCNLKCVYCQNKQISRASSAGKPMSDKELCEIYFKLKARGVHNINLVTPTHFVPHIVSSVALAKQNGIGLPFVYNTSGYENVETLSLLKGYIDIYLTDFKYFSNAYAKRYSNISDYRDVAFNAVKEMFSQTNKPAYSKDGLLKRGTVIRHLILPEMTRDSKRVLKLLYDEFGNSVIYSIMSQYVPFKLDKKYDEINRKITPAEYSDVVSYADEIGIENCYTQCGQAAQESFIPDFNCDEL